MSRDTRRRSAGERKIDPPILLLSRSKKSSSTSKILDFFKASPPSLENALEDFEQAARLAMKVAELQRKGTEKLQRWAQSEGNTAIADVAEKMKQLMLMHCEQQLILAQEASDSMQDLRRMKPESSELEQIEKVRDQLEVEDKKLEKQLNKLQLYGSPSSSNGNDVRFMLSERIRLSAKKDDAEDAIHTLRNEAEVTKMFIFRRSVKSYADAFVNYAKNANVIFSATRELAELVPAVATEDVHHLRYEGGEVSRRTVNQVRRSLEHKTVTFEGDPLPSQLISAPQMRVPVTPLKMGSTYKAVGQGASPPPPYSPGARYCNY